MSDEFLILSIKWTDSPSNSSDALVWYRENAKGYTCNIESAGRFSAEEASEHIHPGITCAVPVESVKAEARMRVPFEWRLIHEWSALPSPGAKK